MNTSQPARWFRMYAEFAIDPKVQMLSEVDQRRFIMLLCNRCSNGDVTFQEQEVAFQLRITEEEWMKTKEVLLQKNLISKDNKPTSWEKRQLSSDSSSQRVRRHRAAKKENVTLQKRYSNGDVTVQSRVEIEKEIELKDLNTSVSLDAPQATKKKKKQKTLPDEEKERLAQASEVIGRANKIFSLRWKKPHRFLTARIREGATVDDCLRVIGLKHWEWDGTEQEQYIRQETLFRESKFEGYLQAAKNYHLPTEVEEPPEKQSEEWLSVEERTEREKKRFFPTEGDINYETA